MKTPGRFRYLRDPLCVTSWCAYACNRWLVKPRLPAGEGFLRGHFNDLLLVPSALPLLLWLHRKLSLRRTDAPPSFGETAVHLLVWSLYFELVGPAFYARATADWRDVLAYWAGGVIAWAFWNRPRKVLPSTSAPKPC